MLAEKKDLILQELENGTGATIGAAADFSNLLSGLKIWFGDLDEKHGPVAVLRRHGLKGHRVCLSFGSFSGEVIAQIRKAPKEDLLLARALVASIPRSIEIDIPGQNLSDWSVTTGGFRIVATVRDLEHPSDDSAVITTCREILVPLMAAMAELIGYDEIDQSDIDEQANFDGAISLSVVQRRERNPRNRLLCIRTHGEFCAVCGLVPKVLYGAAGGIIEVHHLEPLALLVEPKLYDPCTDLIPLCPSCHRAIHTKRPVPFSIEELKAMIGGHRD